MAPSDPVAEAEMRKIFNQFDQDGNGLLDEFEILDALRSLWYVRCHESESEPQSGGFRNTRG